MKVIKDIESLYKALAGTGAYLIKYYPGGVLYYSSKNKMYNIFYSEVSKEFKIIFYKKIKNSKGKQFWSGKVSSLEALLSDINVNRKIKNILLFNINLIQ